MAVDLSGTWKLVRSTDNYDDFLKSLGKYSAISKFEKKAMDCYHNFSSWIFV